MPSASQRSVTCAALNPSSTSGAPAAEEKGAAFAEAPEGGGGGEGEEEESDGEVTDCVDMIEIMIAHKEWSGVSKI